MLLYYCFTKTKKLFNEIAILVDCHFRPFLLFLKKQMFSSSPLICLKILLFFKRASLLGLEL